jgi:hypothetical protein
MPGCFTVSLFPETTPMARPKPSKWKPSGAGQKAPSTDPKPLREALFKAFGAKSDPDSASEVDALLQWAKDEFWNDHDAKSKGPTRGQMRAALELLTTKTKQLEEQLSSTDPNTRILLGSHLATKQTPRTGLTAFASALREFQDAITASLKVLDTENPGQIAFNLWPTFEHLPFRSDKNFDPLAGFFYVVFVSLRDIRPFAAQSVPSFAWRSGTGVSKRCDPVLTAAQDFLKRFKSPREYAEAAERARREIRDQDNFETQ